MDSDRVLRLIVLGTGAILLTLVLGSVDPRAQSVGLCGVSNERGSENDSPPFGAPPGGTVRLESGVHGDRCTLRWANGELYAEANTDSKGRPTDIRYYTAVGQLMEETNIDYGDAEDGGDEDVIADKCATDTRNIEDPDWGISNLGWRINTGSLPGYLKDQTGELADTVQAIRNGRIAWESNINPCGVADNSAINFTYNGSTTATYGRDNLSIVDYGEVNGACSTSTTAFGCAKKWYSVTTGDMVECDIRLDNDVNWTKTTPPASGAKDIWGVISHETGHCAMLGHVGDVNQIMRQGLANGSAFKRNLSLGDAKGNNEKH